MTSKIGQQVQRGPMPSKLSRGGTKRSTFECPSPFPWGPGTARSLATRLQRIRRYSRKEVIQPQVLLQLPCYDFTPITAHILGGFLSCESEHRLLVQPTFVM